MSEEEYDLRKSTEKVGELYPVIVSKTGETIDGFHRLNAKASWRKEVREDIDSPEKVLKARLIANKFRRQVTAEEVRGWINDLAEIAVNEYGIEPGEISGWVAEETGYNPSSVRGYLNEKYKIITSPLGIDTHAGEGIQAPLVPDIGKALEKAFDKVLPIVDLETPNGLHKAAKALEREANRKDKAQKTPEQTLDDKRKKARKSLIDGKENTLSKINNAKELGIETIKFEDRFEKIKAKIMDNPDEAFKESTKLKKDINKAIKDFKEKKLKEKALQEVTKEIKNKLKDEAKEELETDSDFIRNIRNTVINPPIPSPKEETPIIKPIRHITYPEKILLTCFITKKLNEAIEKYYLDSQIMKDEAIEKLIWKGLECQ